MEREVGARDVGGHGGSQDLSKASKISCFLRWKRGPTCGPFPYSSILHPYRFPPPSQGLAIPTSSACPSSSSHIFYTTLALVNCLFLKPP